MICQECKERPATLHFTKVINGEKTTIQLCEKCAQEKGDLFLNEGPGAFSFNNLLSGLLNFDSAFQQAKTSTTSTSPILQCDVCKMTYQQFAKVGRFGCAHCYETFRNQLVPVIKRLHSGNIEHGGKVPKRIGGSLHVKKKLQQLKGELQSLIANEEFEQAAKVRDQIRSLEKNFHDGEGNGR
ncbi:UvrB/UvrC motif-containing protein [Lederbergia sp. NSJ-179]|uniref:UvrB/UvrC motif-containing protein n=1 Tax=Lederbergia sp. NSJ-179 TaxID=2931402 RepID=UPI001FD39277|nr:UvrB/UvrC motif-containing protein [Lederbergia sp. NSJ-179]MCJ7843356.1 UvrB/UvrC motif-containing protein [Lederbergia sp. NSJ-179]